MRDVPGNAAVAEADVNALLYHDADGFARRAMALIDDAALRRSLSRPDPERFSPEREAQTLAAIYREALGGQVPN